jgi:hypothetical protein
MLSDFVEISSRFQRSVNLEKDYAAGSQNGEYIITPTARQILHRLSEALEDRSPYRAWTITGPYGVGKSAFGVFLTRVLCSQGAQAAAASRRLEEVDRPLAHAISRLKVRREGRKAMFPVLTTARRVSAGVCLLDGIAKAAGEVKGQAAERVLHQARGLLRHANKGGIPDSREVVGCIGELAQAVAGRGHTGLLIMVDELGKLFEYAAHTPQKADVFVLQELAEYASRSGGLPVVVLGFLHQSFEEYGRHIDSVSRNEWAKIQGRFQDVAFLEPPEQVLRMVAAAIKWKPNAIPPSLRKQIQGVAEQAVASGICPPGMKKADFVETCLRAYPLHPSTAVALPYLFHRFAQNERSLFSYLSSHEPKGFRDFLRSQPLKVDGPSFVRIPEIFDYFTANFGSGLFRQPHARRWMEAADLLDRRDNLGGPQADLIKTVGVLNALGAFCHLTATKGMISFAVADAASSHDVDTALAALAGTSALTYRKFNDTYRIWEGSDVDIEERISQGQRKTRGDLRLAEAIQRCLPAKPLVARRHSFETGTFRYFQVRYVDDPADVSRQLTQPTVGCGLVLVCLSSSGLQLDEFKKCVTQGDAAKGNVLFAIPREMGEIRSTVVELTALQWAWTNTPELRDDRVARRELAMRIADAQQLLLKNLGRLLDPREEPDGALCSWYHHGEQKKNIRTAVHVSHLLSDVCDTLYDKSPRIRNELICRSALSSAAAGARRSLVERMLSHAEEKNLGLDGYPPERSMYESVLKATGIHRQDRQGRWHFADPADKDPCNLRPAWQRLAECIFKPEPGPEPVDRVFKALSEMPYGVPEGLHPVLLCAFLCANSGEVTLYREGTFVPDPGITEFEVLMRRPELFAIAGSRLVGGRTSIVERIAKGLGVSPSTVPVVKALFRIAKAMPEFAKSTMRLSAPTLAMRKAFSGAASPEKFLFVELPGALHVEPFGEQRPASKHIDGFFAALNSALQEWSRATPIMIDTARDCLLAACGLKCGNEGWMKLRELSHRLEPGLTHPTLAPFVRRAAQATPDQSGAESVLALLANRPPQMWTDADVDRFPAIAQTLGEALQGVLADNRSPWASSPLDSMPPRDRAEAKRLASEIETYVKRHVGGARPLIVRAALAIISGQIEADEQKEHG